MTRFGFVALPAFSHTNCMIELALELQRRGDDIVFLSFLEYSDDIKSFGFEVITIGEHDFKKGCFSQLAAELGKLEGLAALNLTIGWLCKTCEACFQEAPDLIRGAAIDLLIVDQVMTAMPSVAELLGIPYVIVCAALVINNGARIPPVYSHRVASTSLLSRLLNFIDNQMDSFFTRSIAALVRSKRQEWKLPLYAPILRPRSELAVIAQFPRSVEFPEHDIPTHHHYVGRLADPSGVEPLCRDVSFPFEKLDGRRLIYASLGTIQNRVEEYYDMVIESCKGLDAQLIVALGDRHADTGHFSGSDAIVVAYAPQEKLVSMAALVVTHGGNNTATMAMSYGVPMVVVPIANDQPGVGARVKRAGLGHSIPAKTLTAEALRSSITELLDDGKYRERCRLVQQEIKDAGGVRTAANVIVQALETRAKVECGWDKRRSGDVCDQAE